MLDAATVDFRDVNGDRVGSLRVSCARPRAKRALPPLVELPSEDRLDVDATVGLLEGSEYRYEVDVDWPGRVRMEPVELFDADPDSGLRGRLRIGNRTGVLYAEVRVGPRRATAVLEVRSSKLSYVGDYRAMLSGVAREASEAVMHRFAPSSAFFRPSGIDNPRTLYHRLAFLKALLESESFRAAVAVLSRRPHERYVEEEERRPPGRGGPVSGGLARRLSRVGAAEPSVVPGSVVAWQPRELWFRRFDVGLDTEPNRFVRYAFEHWRATVASIHEALGSLPPTPAIVRGVHEAAQLLERLDVLLELPLCRQAGRLTAFPGASQVLQKREGYREVYRAYIESEIAARLSWDGGDDVFGAGQRDVATLYEYWTYFQLRRVLAGLCDEGMTGEKLFEVGEHGITLMLRRGHERVLQGTVVRRGRRLGVELWFNRRFTKESWSRPMQPDCAVRITVDNYGPEPSEVWLHFDAKYRVDGLHRLFRSDDDDDTPSPALKAKRSDLLKMHAYRDAIRGSAGAYILYPGTPANDERRTVYDEVLPGVGAFPLAIGPDGFAEVRTAARLSQFVSEVVDHVADQSSGHERVRFWTERSYRGRRSPAASAWVHLERPPADTSVLLGYVRSPEHLDWITTHRLYDLRGDRRRGRAQLAGPELGVDFVVLYGTDIDGPWLWRRGGGVRVMTDGELRGLGCPDAAGARHCCLELGESIPASDASLTMQRILDIAGTRATKRRAPVVVTWETLTCG